MPDSAQNFRLILASASPRRRELLTQAGYIFTVEIADVDESERPGEAPADYVCRLAEQKAQTIFAHRKTAGTPSVTPLPSRLGSNLPLIVVGADTTVVCDGAILGKPAGLADAKRMLRQLSGRKHEVLTGVVVAASHGVLCAVETTVVTFSQIPETELDLYCATHEPLDKAGAYGIQGYAARWVPRIDGDYFNVMGLPISRVVKLIGEALLRQSLDRTR
jgi:septum formation protein